MELLRITLLLLKFTGDIGVPVIGCRAGVGQCLNTEIVGVAGIRVTVRRSGKMRDGVNTERNTKHDESTAYPYRSTKIRAKVADDQKGRCSGYLIRGCYPSSLTAGQRKPTLYCRDGDSE